MTTEEAALSIGARIGAAAVEAARVIAGAVDRDET